MAQTKITSNSLATNTIAAANIADGAIQSRHIESSLFSPAIYSNKINSSTGYMGLPSGTTAQRPVLPPNGSIRYNTTLGYFEWYDSMSTLWIRMDQQKPSYCTIIRTQGLTISEIVDPDDGLKYRVYTYTTPGTHRLIFDRSGYIDFLIVAGGGSGGNHSTTNVNGGGGGGGVVFKKNHFVTQSASYECCVGAGGAAIGEEIASAGNNGTDSYLTGDFTNYIAIGGGGGGSQTFAAKDGGSGGGLGAGVGDRGRTIQPKFSDAQAFGNPGGRTYQSYTGSGGGGAGSEGQGGYNLNSSNNGDGGYGIQFGISGTKKYYGGGGGGSGNSSERAGDGWHGGGRGFGTTSYYTHLNYPIEVNTTTLGSGTPDGIHGTGGGGGAGSHWSNNSTNWLSKGSGAGGDGIVIFRTRIA